MRNIFIFTTLFLILQACNSSKVYKHEGYIFGTIYHFAYESPNGKNYEEELRIELDKFNHSLSTYDKNSIISRINQNDTSVFADYYFKTCFNKAYEISKLTNGAFDMTVAPIVNAWGFGFDKTIVADSNKIDSLMQFVGYEKIKLIDNRIIKDKPDIMLDASAIAKGYGVDVASDYLEKQGVKNYMIEIGGEVRAKGKNEHAAYWRIGIDKPTESNGIDNRELQDIISLKDLSLATSGNYRQFYVKDGIRYAHTINPKTGYPALHSLLSATVLANNCITADALATAFMVMGVNKSIELVNKLDSIEAYFIYTDTTNTYQVYATDAFKKLIE